jgi:hypothetical protein
MGQRCRGPARPTRTSSPATGGATAASYTPLLADCAPPAVVGRVIPGYTQGVKTAISVPDDTYAEATQRASDLGLSRSEFFARAARRYLDELDAESVTAQIDVALAKIGLPDESALDALHVSRGLLSEIDDEW